MIVLSRTNSESGLFRPLLFGVGAKSEIAFSQFGFSVSYIIMFLRTQIVPAQMVLHGLLGYINLVEGPFLPSVITLGGRVESSKIRLYLYHSPYKGPTITGHSAVALFFDREQAS